MNKFTSFITFIIVSYLCYFYINIYLHDNVIFIPDPYPTVYLNKLNTEFVNTFVGDTFILQGCEYQLNSSQVHYKNRYLESYLTITQSNITVIGNKECPRNDNTTIIRFYQDSDTFIDAGIHIMANHTRLEYITFEYVIDPSLNTTQLPDFTYILFTNSDF